MVQLLTIAHFQSPHCYWRHGYSKCVHDYDSDDGFCIAIALQTFLSGEWIVNISSLQHYNNKLSSLQTPGTSYVQV